MDESVSLFLFRLVVHVILAVVFYSVGSKRKIGGTWSAVLVFFLGLIGMIVVWCSRKTDVFFSDEGGDA